MSRRIAPYKEWFGYAESLHSVMIPNCSESRFAFELLIFKMMNCWKYSVLFESILFHKLMTMAMRGN